MGRKSYRRVDGKTAWHIGMCWLLSGMVACNSFWEAPEGRARDFIDTLVTVPTDAQKLQDIAKLAPERKPEDLIDGLSTRVALDFLRAQRDQGATLKFAPGEARRIDDHRRDVTIRVSYRRPGTNASPEVRFQVRLEKDAQGQWRIARVTGDN